LEKSESMKEMDDPFNLNSCASFTMVEYIIQWANYSSDCGWRNVDDWLHIQMRGVGARTPGGSRCNFIDIGPNPGPNMGRFKRSTQRDHHQLPKPNGNNMFDFAMHLRPTLGYNS